MSRCLKLVSRTSPVVKSGLTIRQRTSVAVHHAPVLAQTLGSSSLERHGEILTLLHKTRAFLPRVLPSGESIQGYHFGELLETWNTLLDQVFADVTSGVNVKAQIVVAGRDEWSGTKDLVKALLDEPFASTSGVEDAACDEPNEEINTSDTSSAYLRRFPVAVQLTTLPHPCSCEGWSYVKALYYSDIPVIICNPVSTSIQDLLVSADLPAFNPYGVLIVSSSTSLPPLPSLIGPRRRSPSGNSVQLPRPANFTLVASDPRRAVMGIKALRDDPSSPVAIQRYQDEYLGSGISALKQSLEDFFSSLGEDAQRSLIWRRAMVRITGALMACKIRLCLATKEITTIGMAASRLEGDVAEMQAKVELEILGSCSTASSASSGPKPADEVEKALSQAETAMLPVLQRLTWWRMIMRADYIGTIVGDAVDRVWCRDLETKLVLATGRLLAVQEHLCKATFSSMGSLPHPSSVLKNRLLQLQASPSFLLAPHMLTSPLTFRRQQIIDYPTTQLQLAASRATLTVGGSLATGTAIIWSGWLADAGPLAFLHMDVTTVFGVGLLTCLLGIRRAVGIWEKGKKRWWEDWNRIGNGLSRDLKSTLRQVVRNNVVAIPETAVRGLLDTTAKLKARVADTQDELDTLKEEAETLQQLIRMK